MSSGCYPHQAKAGNFRDIDIAGTNPNTTQFEPTDAKPIRQHAQMAGDPFVSQAQRGFMYSQHPDIAKRWEKHTPKGKKLPRYVKRKGG